MRHLTGMFLAVVMVLAMFFAGAWGYVRLLRPPVARNAPLSALPAHGGALLSTTSVLAALGALAGAGLLAGILIAAPRISPLAAGLPGLFAIAWQALYLLNVNRAVEIIPLRAHAFGAGWEALLFNGILGAAGLVMIVPLFVPSRWRRRPGDAEEAEATDYMAELRATSNDPTARPAISAPAVSARTISAPAVSPPAGAVPVGMTRTGGAPWDSPGVAPTSANPVPASMRPPRGGLVGGSPRPVGSPQMRPRPYRGPDGV
ncbi:MAG: hypothetical protein J2P25_03295 [Nocardiopsaceae bacterium]|nr:hypothetical protein [Nocardiopsaceae bacterium]